MKLNGFFGLAFALFLSAVVCPLSAEEIYEWTGNAWKPAAKPEEGSAAGELALLRQYWENVHYKKLVKAAKKFLKRYPDSDEYEEACLLAGQSEIHRNRYFQAYEWFERQLSQFPSGRFSDRALEHEYEIAEAFLAGKKRIVLGFLRVSGRDDALEILQRIAEHAPGSALAERALLRVGDYYYDEGDWIEATEAYDAFLIACDKSPKAPYAMLQAAHATYNSFNGVAFEDTPLLAAEQRVKNLLESYPQAARRANVEETLSEISATRAEKVFLAGQFYERTHRSSPAAFCYRDVIERFPTTPWATMAQDALIRLDQADDVSAPVPSPQQMPPETQPADPITDTDNGIEILE